MNPKTLHKISYGLYIVSSIDKEKINGQVANSLFQVTSEPQTIAVSINKDNLTHEYIKKSQLFNISVLSEKTSMELIGNFGFKSGRNINKFEKINYKLGKYQVPIILDFTLAYIETRVIDYIDIGTHTIFIGKVEDAEIITKDKQMTYEYYHKCKGGYSPKNAPTYNKMVDKTDNSKEGKKMDRYVCKICGYKYDPEKGDPENGIAIGTKFEDLPDDWVCPICGVVKEDFEKE